MIKSCILRFEVGWPQSPKSDPYFSYSRWYSGSVTFFSFSLCMSSVLLLLSLPPLVEFRKTIVFCVRNGRKFLANFPGSSLSDNSPSTLAARGNFQTQMNYITSLFKVLPEKGVLAF